jgi:nucleotidyltransferase/DNA polymerase involved in DNA repair
VSNIKGVGKGVQKLLKDNDINTIADLHGLDMQTMNDIAGRMKGLSLASLK